MTTDSTPVASNTRSNNPTLITGDNTSPLPHRTLMERGDSGETKEESKTEDTADPPPPLAANQVETDSDSSDKDYIMSATTETDYLKYLASEYKTLNVRVRACQSVEYIHKSM